VPVAFAPITLDLEPPGTFDAWLVKTLAAAAYAAHGRGPQRQTTWTTRIARDNR
jgi:hypothetical protein